MGDARLNPASPATSTSSLRGGHVVLANLSFASTGNITNTYTNIAGELGVFLSLNTLYAQDNIAATSDIVIQSSDGAVTLNDGAFRAANGGISAQTITLSAFDTLSLNSFSFTSFEGISAGAVTLYAQNILSLSYYSFFTNGSIQVSDTISLTSTFGAVNLENFALYAGNDILVSDLNITAGTDVSLAAAALFAENRITATKITLKAAGSIHLGYLDAEDIRDEGVQYGNSFYAGKAGSRVQEVVFDTPQLNLRRGPGMTGIYNEDGTIIINMCAVTDFAGDDFAEFFAANSDGRPNTSDRLDLYLPVLSDTTNRDRLIASAKKYYDVRVLCCSGGLQGCYSNSGENFLCQPGFTCNGTTATACPATTCPQNTTWGQSSCVSDLCAGATSGATNEDLLACQAELATLALRITQLEELLALCQSNLISEEQRRIFLSLLFWLLGLLIGVVFF